MNYLAHMFLSLNQEDLMIGNLSGDFVRIADMRFMRPEIEQGVILHRKIDKYTDTHTDVAKSIARLTPTHGKYSAVIVDILYDHLLTHNWTLYTEDSLADFKRRHYEILIRRHDDLPIRLQKKIVKMIERDFIEAYRSFEGMRVIMRYMDKRTSFPSDFESSINQYQAEFQDFNEDFNSFFPELMAYVETEVKG